MMKSFLTRVYGIENGNPKKVFKWHDKTPFEVISQNGQKVTARPMKVDEDRKWWQKQLPMGHQKWKITSDKKANVIELHKRKDGDWEDNKGNIYQESEKPVYYRNWGV